MISFDEAVELDPLGREADWNRDCPARAKPPGGCSRSRSSPRIDSPRADVSAMDGYAVRTEDLHELPASLKIIGESFAGAGWQGTVEAGTCARIFTGAPVPAGADRIVDPGKCPPRGRPRDHRRCPGNRRSRPSPRRRFRDGEVLLPAGTTVGRTGDRRRRRLPTSPRWKCIASRACMCSPRATSWPSREPRATGPMPFPIASRLGVALLAERIGAANVSPETGCETICQ